jgi:hypothetical protein
MSSGITTTIKIKPYLKEFILCRFLSGQYRSSADDILGQTIKPFLVSSPENLTRITATSDDNFFTFELPNYSDKKVTYHNYIRPEHQRYIERIFEYFFREAMFHFVKQNHELNRGDIKDWIINWCNLNNITFAKVNYETLKKAYWRYRVDQEEKEKNEKNTSRSLPCVSPRYHFIVPQVSPKNKAETVEPELEFVQTEN